MNKIVIKVNISLSVYKSRNLKLIKCEEWLIGPRDDIDLAFGYPYLNFEFTNVFQLLIPLTLRQDTVKKIKKLKKSEIT